MITIEQCRAARGLLGWTQQDLADASGLSKTAINNFEKGHSDIKNESLRAIRAAFENLGIEFIAQEGLRKRSESATILRGPSALEELFRDIHETLQDTQDELLISNPAAPASIATQLKQENPAECRILCAESSIAALRNHACRELDEDLLRAAPGIFLYGSKIAFELWDQSMIVVVNSPEAALAERERFELLWELGGEPNTHNHNHNDNNNKAAHLR
jgi:transcriptional regulator with XRE-family HTH domain